MAKCWRNILTNYIDKIYWQIIWRKYIDKIYWPSFVSFIFTQIKRCEKLVRRRMMCNDGRRFRRDYGAMMQCGWICRGAKLINLHAPQLRSHAVQHPRAARPKQASPRERNKSHRSHNVDEAQTARDKSIPSSIQNISTYNRRYKTDA